jgi:hypothetical protein
MRQRLERDIYNLMFITDGGLISSPEPIPPYSESRQARNDYYMFAFKMADQALRSLREPSDKVVAAMAAMVLADGDIRDEWQAGIDAAGKG